MEKAKILVVEDSATQAQMVRLILEIAGYDVVMAADGAEGLELFDSRAPDLVLLDLNLPKMNGFEVCEAIKTPDRKRFTPVIMLTTEADVDSKVKGLDLGADDYLPKPFDSAELLARARAMLRIKGLEDRIIKLSVTDDLTGLCNRRFFMQRIEEELDSAARYEHRLGLIFFDIDHFKNVNDNFGHQFGDRVLRQVAQIASRLARKGDISARYGGEEFVLVLRGVDSDRARFVADRLREQISSTVFSDEKGAQVKITVSCGVASYPDDVDNPHVDDILRAADDALYLAKKLGRDRTEVYRPSA